MTAIERLTISVPAEMAATLRETVSGGEYASTSEVVREALRDWSRAREEDRRMIGALREALGKGDESGPSVPADEVFAELRRLIDARRADRA